MNIRPYRLEDKIACIEIFNSNCPEYFDPREFYQFDAFLDSDALKNYFIIEENGKVVACGGYDLDEKRKTGLLTWGQVHKNCHKNGYGKILFNFRVNEIKKAFNFDKDLQIEVETSQKVYKFFEKLSFKVVNIAKDFYGQNLDKYSMRLEK